MIEFAPADPMAPPASELLAAMEAEMVELYGIGACGIGDASPEAARVHIGVPLSPGEMAPPAGVYLVGAAAGEVVAGGGLRTIAPGVGEIKRMYVVPAWRGRGAGRLLLEALEAWAREELGLTTVRLDTGPKQPGAQRMYERAGYRSIGNYNDNRYAAFWGEKPLTGGDAGP